MCVLPLFRRSYTQKKNKILSRKPVTLPEFC